MRPRSGWRTTRRRRPAGRTRPRSTARSRASRSCSTRARTRRSSRSSPPHRAGPGGAGAQRGPQRAAGEGPRGGDGDVAGERDPERAADEGACERRGRRRTRGRSSPRSTAAALKELLDAGAGRSGAGKTKNAAAALNRFKEASRAGEGRRDGGERRREGRGKASRDALISAAEALLDQVKGATVDTTGTGVTVGPADPGDQAIRVFWNPTPFAANPRATYKVLVNGRAGGFRHQAIVDARRCSRSSAPRTASTSTSGTRTSTRGPGPAGSGRRVAGDEPVPRPGDAEAVQDDRHQLDRGSERGRR